MLDALDAPNASDLGHRLRDGWPGEPRRHYEAMVARVADVSAERWRDRDRDDAESMLWRLLRIGSAPYFVLGAAVERLPPPAHRDALDWRRTSSCARFDVEARAGGQPMVAWRAVVRERATRRRTRSSPATSRSAGAMAASRAAPKRRCTSTHRTRMCPATSP